MLFNRQGLQQKNWRMVKKGKHILFGCSLFFVVGAVNISGPKVTYAGDVSVLEIVAKQEKNSNVGEENSNAGIPTLEKEKQTQSSNNKRIEKITASETLGVSIDKKEVNKKELEDLVAKIKKADVSKKTEESAEKLNLILSRAEKILEDLEITQEEIDKEVKALKEAFDNLEDKAKEDKKSEAKEKVESKKEEKSNVEKNTKEKHQENTTEDVARKHNEKIIKVTETVTEIHSIASQINYEFSDAEKELVKTAENLSIAHNSDKNNEETIQKLLNEVIYLRNKVANRMTREHSGKRDPRNGKQIENNGESTFRGIRFTPLENTQNGKVVSNGDTNLTYFNSDDFWIKTQVKGEKFRHDSANTYYLVKKVTLSGKPFKDLSIIVSSGTGDRRASTTIDNINNPNVQAGILGNLGTNGIITPGNYQVVLTVNDTVSPGNNYNIIYNITIKPQSERNTVRDLTPTYVDDVRHLTEAEKTALIEKFKTEHPDVVNRAQHIDFDHAEISSDGTTMTVHFKDGLSTKTIQTNAQNDAVAKHPSLTTLVGEPHEFYKNPRNLVKSKTNNEVPQTARVTWKTPFDFSQPGTKNAVVTVSYDNGVTKDVTAPYTVLDFVGKQDKSINQNQSGELGDARSYITLSNGAAPATDLTIRWKGGSSVDTSAQGVQRKEIEILRGNTVMKTVTIPVAIVDNINPTITAPDSVLLTRAEGLPGNISIDAQDNAGGIGLKDSNPIVVENLANPLRYNPSTKKIELSGIIPNNFQRTQATIKAVDKNGNTATKTITFNVQAQTDKYNAVANPQKQSVSYDARPDAGLSVNKNGLPAGTTYTWATTPSTTTGPGDKAGVVIVSYPDGSTDTVNVTIAVRKLSDEHEPTGTKIVRNQNVPVTNNDLKAAVNVNNNGNSKVKSVTSVSSISTANAGMQTIRATVTYLDNTTDPVEIPLEVKDVTGPTIQTPTNGQNWDLIALDRTSPSIRVAATDNPGGSGIKSTTVTGLPDFLVYDDATKTIKFKNGVQEVTKLPVGQNSKTYNATIQVTDNANNPSQRQVTITVKSMTTKYNATPNGQKQTVSYGATPDAGTSINKNGLPAGTRYTWATTPSTTTGPGDKAGVVTVTYPDDSIDTVNVTVNVRRLADEYAPTGTKITREQNTAVTNDDLKAAVTISNNGNNKVKSVTPVSTISTAEFGNKTINATVTYLDDTTDSVTIPLEVRDATKPTIQTPTDRQNWDLIALDRTIPSIKVAATDNPGGSGIKSTTITGLPNFLTYDEATKTIKFKNGVQEVTKLPEGTDVQTHNITIMVTDNANNSNSAQVTITVKSMTTKYDATANSEKQTVSYGATPDAATSVNKTNLPTGTTYIWATTPSTTTGPGDKAGVVTVTYPDSSKDTVNVTVNVKGQADTYTPEPKEQTVDNGVVPRAEDSIENVKDLPSGTIFTWQGGAPSTTEKGDHPGTVLVSYPDGTSETVPVVVKVREQKDTYTPEPKEQTVDNGVVPKAEDSIENVKDLPPKTTFEWKDGAPDTEVGQPGEVSGTVIVRYPDGTSEEVPVKVNVRQSNEKGIPEVQRALPEYTDPVGTSSTDGEGNEITPPTVEIPEYTDPVGTSSTDGEGNLITPPTVEIPEYTDPVGTSSTDGEGNEITPPTAEVPEYTGGVNGDPEAQPMLPEFVGGVNGEPEVQPMLPEFNGGVNGDPEVQSTLPEFAGGVNGDPEAQSELSEYTGGENGDPEVQLALSEFSGGVNGNPEEQLTLPEFAGGVNGDPEAQPMLPEFNGGVKGEPEAQPMLPEFNGGANGDPEVQSTFPEYTGGVNGEPEAQPDFPEYTGGVNGNPEAQPDFPEYTGGVNGAPEVQSTFPEYTGGVNGEPEVQPRLPEFAGGVNGEPEEQPTHPEFVGGVNGDPEVQPTLPEFVGGVNGEPEVQAELPKYVGKSKDESEIRSSFRDKTSNVATKRLANTGQSQNNSELAGLGLVIVGLFAAIKRRKNEEE